MWTDIRSFSTGRESRTNLRNNNVFGPAFGRHVAATVDFGATWHVTEKFRVLDTFTFSSFRNPGQFDSSNCQFFSPILRPAPMFSLLPPRHRSRARSCRRRSRHAGA